MRSTVFLLLVATGCTTLACPKGHVMEDDGLCYPVIYDTGAGSAPTTAPTTSGATTAPTTAPTTPPTTSPTTAPTSTTSPTTTGTTSPTTTTTSSPTTTTGGTTTHAGTGALASWTVSCTGGAWWVELYTDSPVGSALFNTWETDVDFGWDEEHPLAVAGDGLSASASLEAGVPFYLWAPGSASFFDCSVHAAGSLTMALRVYDAAGIPLSCAIFGHDPIAVRAGLHPINNPLTNPHEIYACDLAY
jgi:hypothetical protein